MTVIDGQLDIFHAIAMAEIPEGDRIHCEECGSNWGTGLKPEILERKAEEHLQLQPGICAHMVRLRELLDRLERGLGWAHIVWTPEGKAEHLAKVRSNVEQTWARYNA